MSDETIQYITTDYLIEVDGGEPTPAPIEYIVELGQVGVQGIPGEKGEPGFSPTVGYILNDNTFKINITNQDGVTPTPNLYDYFADKNGYLKVDGSNAEQGIIINQAEFISLANNSGVRIRNNNGRGGLQLSPDNTYLQTGSYGLVANYANQLVSFGNVNGTAKVIQATADKVYYEAYSSSPSDSNNEIATIGDIPTVSDATITLTQGGVTKGTFTLNGSATTINLDAGGGSIPNPLTITEGDWSLNFGIDNNNKAYASYVLSNSGMYMKADIQLIESASSPITITPNSLGLNTIGLNIDDTTIKVNQDGELYAVGGGGGTTYTAGTGIDITSDVISVDNTVAMKTDIPDTTYMVTTNTAQTISGSKTFSSETHHTGVITFDSALATPIIRGMSGANYRNMIYRTNSSSSITVGNSNDTIDLKGSGTRPTYNSNDLALYSDIPTVPTIATGSTNGTISVGGTDVAVYGLGSAAYTSSSDYVDLTTTQTITGNKTFNGNTYFKGGSTYITNTSGNNIAYFTYSGTSDVRFRTASGSNRDINFIPDGTGEVQWNGNKLALYSDIPSVMTGATSGTAGTAGLVPAPAAGDEGKVLQGDGTWVTPSSGGLQNTATGTGSLTILGTATTDTYSIAIGDSSNASRNSSVAIGNGATTISQESVAIGYGAMAGDNSNPSYGSVCIGYNAGGEYTKSKTVSIGSAAQARSEGGIAIGDNATVSTSNYQYNNGIAIGKNAVTQGSCAIQLGTGTNSTDCSMYVGFDNTDVGYSVQENWKLLDGTTGLIPDARLSSNIARTSDIPSISNLADKDLSNLSSTGQAVIDGQWVVVGTDISTANAVGSYTLDISSLLPADNYKYEVILACLIYGSGDIFYQSVYTTEFPSSYVTGTSSVIRNLAVIPVGTNRIISYAITSNGNTSPNGAILQLCAYRRIGTNS